MDAAGERNASRLLLYRDYAIEYRERVLSSFQDQEKRPAALHRDLFKSDMYQEAITQQRGCEARLFELYMTSPEDRVWALIQPIAVDLFMLFMEHCDLATLQTDWGRRFAALLEPLKIAELHSILYLLSQTKYLQGYEEGFMERMDPFNLLIARQSPRDWEKPYQGTGLNILGMGVLTYLNRLNGLSPAQYVIEDRYGILKENVNLLAFSCVKIKTPEHQAEPDKKAAGV